MKHKGFTLVELILVMALVAILALLIIGNFNATLKKGRDARRKNDLSQIQKTLELYYEDNRTYPVFADNDIFGKKLCTGHTASATTACAVTETTYMVRTPQDPNSAYTYRYEPSVSGSSYYLYAYIENDLDQSSGVSISGFTTNEKCDAAKTITNCRYAVSSSNADPLTPNP